MSKTLIFHGSLLISYEGDRYKIHFDKNGSHFVPLNIATQIVVKARKWSKLNHALPSIEPRRLANGKIYVYSIDSLYVHIVKYTMGHFNIFF